MSDHDWAKAMAEAEVLAEAERIVRDSLYDDPPVGTPASVGVGSDSYPAVVTDVVRYKSGSRKGKVREILVAQVAFEKDAVVRSSPTGGYGHDFTIDVTHPSVTHRDGRAYTRRERTYTNWQGTVVNEVRWVRKGGADYESVGLGEARDYRDPHF